MTLSGNEFKNFETIMKKMKFKDSDMFLKYCVLKTVRPKLTENQKKL